MFNSNDQENYQGSSGQYYLNRLLESWGEDNLEIVWGKNLSSLVTAKKIGSDVNRVSEKTVGKYCVTLL